MQQIDLMFDEREPEAGWLRITIPFLICGVFLVVLYGILPIHEFFLLFGIMVAYVVPPAGRETVIPVGILLGIPWWLIAFTLVLLDFAGGLFMAWNFPLVLRIPYLGPWIQQFMAAGRTYLDKRPWLEKLYFVGLVLFVSIPFEGSGSIVGSIIGRMLGMTKMEVLACITIGGIIGSFGIALGADYIRTLFLEDVGPGISLVAFLLFGIALLVMYRSYLLRRDAAP
jgi:uncharacterized membrane protein